MFRNNLRYKLLALAIAVTIWTYADVGQNQNVSSEFSVPLEVRNLSSGYIVTSAPTSARVVIRGRRENMDSVADELYAVTSYLDMHDAGLGRRRVPVRVSIPKEIAHLVHGSAKDGEVVVTVEAKAQRILDVDTQLIGSIPTGYQYSSPQVVPSRAVVSGTARSVARVSRLSAAVDPSESGGGSIDEDRAIAPTDESGNEVKGVDVTPARAHLRMHLLVAPTSRVVYVTPTIEGQPQFPHKVTDIQVEPQTVTVSGRPERIARFSLLKTEPLDVSHHTRTFAQNVNAIVPPGVNIVGGRKVKVTVQIGSSAGPGTPPPAAMTTQ